MSEQSIRIAIIGTNSETKVISEKLSEIENIEVIDTPTRDMIVDIIIVSQSGYKQNVNVIKNLKKNTGCAIIGITSSSNVRSFYEKVNSNLIDDVISSETFFTDGLLPVLVNAFGQKLQRELILEKNEHENTNLNETQGRLIAITGGTATGKTSLAVNMAISLSKMKYKILLVDGSLQADDVDIYLDVQRKNRTMYDIIVSDSIRDYDTQIVPSLVKYRELDLLLSPIEFTDADQIEPVAFSEILEICKPEYDFIIVDTSSHVDDISDAIYTAATDIIILSNQTIQSAYYGRKIYLFITQCQFDGIPLLVANETDVLTLIEPEEVEKIIGLKIATKMPYERKKLIEAANEGLPTAIRDKQCDYTKSIKKFAATISSNQPISRKYNKDYEPETNEKQEKNKQKPESLIGKLFKKKEPNQKTK